MLSNNVKCYGEALDLLIEMSTPINKGLVDFLHDYHGYKYNVSKIYEERKYKEFLEKGNVKETLVFLSFVRDTLNKIVGDKTRLGENLINHSYFNKELKANRYEVSFYESGTNLHLSIEFAPKSKIGKLISLKNYLTDKKIQKILKNEDTKTSEKIALDISLKDMHRSLGKEELEEYDNGKHIGTKEVENIALKKYALSRGVSDYSQFDQIRLDGLHELREYSEMKGKSYPLLTGVTNHYIYMNLLLDISERFEKNEIDNKKLNKIETKLLEKLFIKNVVMLDALSDLAHKNINIHKNIWESALLSLSDSEIPFVMNFKKLRGKTFESFSANLLRKLQEIEKEKEEEPKNRNDQFHILGFMNEDMVRIYSALMRNLVLDRVLSYEIINSPPLNDLIILLKEKAHFLSNFQNQNISEKLMNTIDLDTNSVLEMELERKYEKYGDILKEASSNAQNFISVYSYDVKDLAQYVNTPYDKDVDGSGFEFALKDGVLLLTEDSLIKREEKQSNIYHTVINVDSMYAELNFERNNTHRFIYMSILKKMLSQYFPNVQVKISGEDSLTVNISQIRDNLVHGDIKRFIEIEKNFMKLPEKMKMEITSLNTSENAMSNSDYELMALGAMGKIVNAFIWQQAKENYQRNSKGGISNFTSMTRGFMDYHNGQIIIEPISLMLDAYKFFDNEYIKTEKQKEQIRDFIRELEIQYKMSTVKKDVGETKSKRKI